MHVNAGKWSVGVLTCTNLRGATEHMSHQSMSLHTGWWLDIMIHIFTSGQENKANMTQKDCSVQRLLQIQPSNKDKMACSPISAPGQYVCCCALWQANQWCSIYRSGQRQVDASCSILSWRKMNGTNYLFLNTFSQEQFTAVCSERLLRVGDVLSLYERD